MLGVVVEACGISSSGGSLWMLRQSRREEEEGEEEDEKTAARTHVHFDGRRQVGSRRLTELSVDVGVARRLGRSCLRTTRFPRPPTYHAA